MDQSPICEPLESLRSLNGMFLCFLQRCALSGVAPLDLPRGLERRLAGAGAAELERAARLPRALFRVRLPEPDQRAVVADLASALERMQRSLRLTILLTVRDAARRSGHRARLFYGLEVGTMARLRAASLAELPELADAPRLLGCAFAEAEPLWCGLLSRRGQGLASELRLLALQPELAHCDQRPAVERLLAI